MAGLLFVDDIRWHVNSDPKEMHFASIGWFQPDEARKLFAALAQAHIEFRAEFDDGIRTADREGGRFGQASRVLVRIDPAKMDEVQQIQAGLFGDGLPNYDSTFFENEPPVDFPELGTTANESLETRPGDET